MHRSYITLSLCLQSYCTNILSTIYCRIFHVHNKKPYTPQTKNIYNLKKKRRKNSFHDHIWKIWEEYALIVRIKSISKTICVLYVSLNNCEIYYRETERDKTYTVVFKRFVFIVTVDFILIIEILYCQFVLCMCLLNG